MRGKPLALAWSPFQARTVALARDLGGRSCFVTCPRLRKSAWGLPLRYGIQAVLTWRALERHDPSAVIVITPPPPAPLMVWLWCRLHRRSLVVDCHTETFHSAKWGWAAVLLRPAFAGATAVLVHTQEAETLVRSWGVSQVILLVDDLPQACQAAPPQGSRKASVLVAGGLDSQEPVAAAIEAAALLPDVAVRFTGDSDRIPSSLRRRATRNVTFSGYLPYPEFLGELEAADVVAAFSLDPQIMNRAAFEAIGLGRPLVLSDQPGLRRRFGETALLCRNEPRAMAETLRQALDQQAALAARSVRARRELAAERDAGLERLRSCL